MIGRTISHYTILEKLGEGGMGAVYRAEDTRLKRTVALKFLPPPLTADQEVKERFIREAQAASSLQHNNICNVHDIDETPDGQMFIVMDLYEGETLQKKIERRPLKIEEAIDIAVQVAQGLIRAHEHGIVHRDIKPANIMVTADGVAKIVDFGLAKLSGRSMLTKVPSTIGTIAYMSPEQSQGNPVDHRTDIWSLGVLLYEMVTGQLPFKGDYENAVVYSILNTQPEPMTGLRTGVPVELDRIVGKATAKDPSERYQHMDELLVDLRSCSKARSTIGTHTQLTRRPPQRTARLAWYGTAVGLFALAVIAYVLVPRDDRANPRLKMIAVLPFENLGSPEDEYFADGLTDEITSRLSAIGRLGVISRTSSMQYKKTSKTLPAVAKELGVDYILEGTIRWVKTGDSQRIRITPQLINVSGDTHLWADNIDRTLDDIFAVQAEIATRVVKSLDIVLAEGEKLALEAIPTRNLEAYQAYLRGLSFVHREESPHIRMAIEMFQRAVELDSTFAIAYARLSYAHLRYFWMGYGRTKERLSQAKDCLDRSFALRADLPEAYISLGYYYYYGYRNYDRALEALAVAEKKLPNNSDVLSAVAYIWRRQGKYEASIERLKRAFELDPQATELSTEIGNTLWILGRYAEGEEYLDRSIALLPDQEGAYVWKSGIYLIGRGDIKKSRRELERVPSQYQPWVYSTWLDIYERNYPSALERLARAPVATSVEQQWIIPASQLRGIVYRFMNDTVRSHASFDSARVFLESEIKKRPDDNRLRRSLGIVYAGLGRKDEAVREAEFAVEQLPISADAMFGADPLRDLAHVYVMVGKYDSALDKLEYLISLRGPKYITAHLLRLDPTYDPLRGNPRFQALLVKHE